MRNIILTDVDGVLLNWEEQFVQWMTRHGMSRISTTDFDHAGIDISKSFKITLGQAMHYIRIFNESADIGFLPPLRDAIKYVKKLHEEHGYVFHAITSFSTNDFSYDLRKQNLISLFGPTAIQRIVALGINESKENSLKPYANQDMFFIEDRITNVDLAFSMGIEGILMKHNYNKHYDGQGMIAENWKDVYNYITNGTM